MARSGKSATPTGADSGRWTSAMLNPRDGAPDNGARPAAPSDGLMSTPTLSMALQTPAARIRRTSLHDQVTDTLREMIVSGALAPGAHIIESELGDQLGVSRTPLRESLKTLAGEGLVDLVPARGAFVRRVTAEDAQAMLEVLTGLEAFAGRLACERASSDGIRHIEALHDDLERHFADRQRAAYVQTNLAIHQALVALSANHELIATHGHFSLRSRRVRFSGAVSDEAWAAAIAEHREMRNGLMQRDPDRLARVLREHIRLVWDRIKTNF